MRKKRNLIIKLKSASAAIIHQTRAVDPPIRDAAGADQDAVAGSTGEVTPAAHGAVVFAFGASELQTQPEPRSEVSRAEIPDGCHVVGTVQEDLHAHSEAHLSVRRQQGAGPSGESTAAPAEGV